MGQTVVADSGHGTFANPWRFDDSITSSALEMLIDSSFTSPQGVRLIRRPLAVLAG